MPTFTKIALTLLTLLAMPRPTMAGDTEGFRFLNIPVRGIIGIDITREGGRQAIDLARNQQVDGIVLTIDAEIGDLDAGTAIAELVRTAGKDLRTVAVLRQAGGPALPIIYACRDWLVLSGDDQTPVDRVVVATRPAWPGDGEALRREMETLHKACLSAMVDVLPDGPTGPARTVFAKSLMQPGYDLLTWSAATPVQMIKADAPTPQGGTRIPVATRGPGIDVSGLEQARLAVRVNNTLESLASGLAVPRVVSEGDPGRLLVANDAEEAFRRRQAIGSLIDDAFATIDGMDSLSSAFPWTLERAKLADPTADWRRHRYPMQAGEDGWVFTKTGRSEWKRAVDNAARRWRGVVAIADELTKLTERGHTLKAQLAETSGTLLDGDRLDAARDVFNTLFERQLKRTGHMLSYVEKGCQRIAEIEALSETPPTVPFSDR